MPNTEPEPGRTLRQDGRVDSPTAVTAAPRALGLAHALRLELFGVGWNVVETGIGIAAGIAAGSVALLGFGLDSVVEASSGSVVLWRLISERRGSRSVEEAEERAVRLLAFAFGALAIYVAIHSTVNLVTRAHPEESMVGIVLASVSLVVMPVLAWRKKLAAKALDSRSLDADAKQTILCAYLSFFLLVGLVANAALGWWWADPVAGLAIAALAADEARELWKTKELCCT